MLISAGSSFFARLQKKHCDNSVYHVNWFKKIALNEHQYVGLYAAQDVPNANHNINP